MPPITEVTVCNRAAMAGFAYRCDKGFSNKELEAGCHDIGLLCREIWLASRCSLSIVQHMAGKKSTKSKQKTVIQSIFRHSV